MGRCGTGTGAGSGSGSGTIEPGTSGVLVTCVRGREALCVRECYALFGRYLPEPDSPAAGSFEAAVEAEIRQLRSTGREKQVVSVPIRDVSCLVFMRTAAPIVPSDLVHRIASDGARPRSSARYCDSRYQLAPRSA